MVTCGSAPAVVLIEEMAPFGLSAMVESLTTSVPSFNTAPPQNEELPVIVDRSIVPSTATLTPPA